MGHLAFLVLPVLTFVEILCNQGMYFKNDVKEFFKHMFDYNFRRLLRDENC